MPAWLAPALQIAGIISAIGSTAKSANDIYLARNADEYKPTHSTMMDVLDPDYEKRKNRGACHGPATC